MDNHTSHNSAPSNSSSSSFPSSSSSIPSTQSTSSPRSPKPRTVAALIDATKSFFEKKGITTSARLDAELLLAHVLGCRRIDLYVRFDQPLTDPQLDRFRDLVRQRGERRPVKQLLGRCEFMSHELEVTPDVLIPRPETETLVEKTLAQLPPEPLTIADIGTGSGNIAVAIALARPDATLYATDISAPALEVARRNVERHALAGRITLLPGDILQPLAERGLALDCIISNPPYVAESEFPALMPEVARYEPRLALVSGQDGLGHTLRLLADAPNLLRPGGLLAIEIGPHVADRALAAAQAADAYENVHVEADLNKLPRVLKARKKA